MSHLTLKLSFVLHAGPRSDCEIQSGWLRAVTLSPKIAMLLCMSGFGGNRLPTSGLTRKRSKSKPATFFASNMYVPNFNLLYLFRIQHAWQCYKVFLDCRDTGCEEKIPVQGLLILVELGSSVNCRVRENLACVCQKNTKNRVKPQRRRRTNDFPTAYFF